VVTARPTLRGTGSCWCGCATTSRPRTSWTRRLAQGKPKNEIIRCLKRSIAREVFAALQPLRHELLTHPVDLYTSVVWALLLLHHRLGWTVQRPKRRAAERDQAAIERWVAERWPQIKQTVSVWACGPRGSLSGFAAGAAA
jgi:Winged helix-turn helix